MCIFSPFEESDKGEKKSADKNESWFLFTIYICANIDAENWS